MDFERHDKQVRAASMRKAFPVERDLPDHLRDLLGRLAEAETKPAPGPEPDPRH
ncbi:hypothetical protein [Limimaricola pyoseonensis]|uniref:Anti-sigma factor NepR domain-containing protein n=1 Tax=Limimaricola pyoseonensis TaxID=521013 RepID=A0A1G7AVJ2_9RHOB|nr:hypothetical protein [Limimaricola pyoseonensis]SDE18025.1 hypothetical protein SAMN04488567_1101 [Limimaricola pyoseonensis]